MHPFRWEAKEAISVSGLQSIDDAAAGVENVDLTFMVDKVRNRFGSKD
jgi:hypothetical protein